MTAKTVNGVTVSCDLPMMCPTRKECGKEKCYISFCKLKCKWTTIDEVIEYLINYRKFISALEWVEKNSGKWFDKETGELVLDS